MSSSATTAPPPGGRRARIARPVAITATLALPAILLRVSGTHPDPLLGLLVFGGGVVAASFLLAWAAEAVQVDISGGLAIALLAFIAVLPEYVVSLYFAFEAGDKPEYVHYAAGNLLGANQLVLGIGWPVLVLVGLRAIAKRKGHRVRDLILSPTRRLELAFLGVAGVLAFVMPLSGEIHLSLGLVLLGIFALYLRQVSTQAVTEPELMGTPEQIALLPQRNRRTLLASMFVFAAAAVFAAAEPFADALLETGTELGVSKVLLVQWLAPLASEAPEFIVAILLAHRGNADDGLGALLSSKINQWTLLVGSFPLAYLAGGGHIALPLDSRQIAETTLTAAQTALGFAVLLRLRFHIRAAAVLFALFAVQFTLGFIGAVPFGASRYVISAVYGVLATAVLVRDRRHIPALAIPFAHWAAPARVARKVAVTMTGVVLLGVGAVLLVAPGPGLIVIALGLIVLGTEYEWARRHGRTTLAKAQRAADAAAARPAALAGSAAFGLGMVVLGVVLMVTDDLPGSGVATGASVVFSGLVILATLAWSVRGRQRRAADAEEDAEELSSAL